MPVRRPRPPSYSVGELFCGAGGLSRGFHSIGFSPVFANDVWPLAVHNFMMNFDSGYRRNGQASNVLALPGSVEGISTQTILSQSQNHEGQALSAGELDVLLGGPPCQGFSVNSHNRSAEDPRNSLFRHYVRILKGVAPKIFVLENVPGMLSLEQGHFFDEFLAEVGRPTSRKSIGYEVEFKILNAAHYGVPQERFRIVVVGTRRDVAEAAGQVTIPQPVHYSLAQAHFKGGRTQTFHYAIGHAKADKIDLLSSIGPKLLPPVSVGDAIDDLPALRNGGGVDGPIPRNRSKSKSKNTNYQSAMRAHEDQIFNHWCRELAHPNTERVKHIPEGGDWRSIPRHLLPPGMQRALRKDHTTRYGRLSSDSLSGTLLTKPDPHWGTFLHYDVSQQRLISVREAARIQSFPDQHIFFGSQVDQYKLCGNAVPPLMAEALARQVKRILDAYCTGSNRRSLSRARA